MATPRAKKALMLDEIRKILKDNRNVILAEYRGLNVEQVTSLRSNMRKAGIKLKVLKNTLSRKAFNENGIQILDQHLKGPTAVSFLSEDFSSSAKAILKYAKSNELFVVKAGYIDGKLLDLNGIKTLAALPSYEVLLVMLLGTLQAPLKGLLTVMQGNTQKLVYALNAIKDKKIQATA